MKHPPTHTTHTPIVLKWRKCRRGTLRSDVGPKVWSTR